MKSTTKKDTTNALRVIAAATELFTEKGVQATTMVEIAEKADLPRGTAISIFDDVEGIYLEMFTNHAFFAIRPLLEQKKGNWDLYAETVCSDIPTEVFHIDQKNLLVAIIYALHIQMIDIDDEDFVAIVSDTDEALYQVRNTFGAKAFFKQNIINQDEEKLINNMKAILLAVQKHHGKVSRAKLSIPSHVLFSAK